MTESRTTLHDFVMLGTTVPEQRRRDGRTFVCSAGYHEGHGLIRIYPLGMKGAPARWSRSSVTIERNPQDSRAESWRLADGRDPESHSVINLRSFTTWGTVRQTERSSVIPDRYFVESITQANDERRSLALIRPKDLNLIWTRPDARNPLDPDQLELLSVERPDGKPEKLPRLLFHDAAGEHCLQVREWGAHELIRKNSLDYATQHLRRALRISPNSTLLIGNTAQHRTAWLVIGVLDLGVVQPALFGMEESA
mgnify:FL=1